MPSDVRIKVEGTVWVFHLRSDDAIEWVNENVEVEDWQQLGHNHFAADWRPAQDLMGAMIEEGLTVDVR